MKNAHQIDNSLVRHELPDAVAGEDQVGRFVPRDGPTGDLRLCYHANVLCRCNRQLKSHLGEARSPLDGLNQAQIKSGISRVQACQNFKDLPQRLTTVSNAPSESSSWIGAVGYPQPWWISVIFVL